MNNSASPEYCAKLRAQGKTHILEFSLERHDLPDFKTLPNVLILPPVLDITATILVDEVAMTDEELIVTELLYDQPFTVRKL